VNNKKMIIFDMDGTIINSASIIASSVNYVRGHLSLEKMEANYMLKKLNEKDISVSEFCYNSKTFTKQHEDLFTKYFNENYQTQIHLYEGMQELLKKLSKKYELSIATNAYTTTAIPMLKYLNIYKYFSIIIGSDKVSLPKPHKEMVDVILNTRNKKKENTLFIGDSAKDEECAKVSGVQFIMVPWGFSEYKNNTIHNISALEESIFSML
jgi:phosphoglycolate phosphatase